jgi:hypothetical protein
MKVGIIKKTTSIKFLSVLECSKIVISYILILIFTRLDLTVRYFFTTDFCNSAFSSNKIIIELIRLVAS